MVVGGGGGEGGGEREGHSVFLNTISSYQVIKLFIRRAGNEDGHKTLNEFEFV